MSTRRVSRDMSQDFVLVLTHINAFDASNIGIKTPKALSRKGEGLEMGLVC